MTTVEHVKPEQFEKDVLLSSVPVLVDFYADWCPPCRALSPILMKLAGELGDAVRIVKINVEEAPDLAAEYRITSIPAMLLFRSGQVVDRIVGLIPEAALKQRLGQVLASVA
jgi:thioredoxin 1